MKTNDQISNPPNASPGTFHFECAPEDHDPRIAALMNDLIGCVAAKWTILAIETLGSRGRLRFSELNAAMPGVSQKVLASTLRRMERDGLLIRTVYPEVPPRVEYELTPTGATLGAAFCGVWLWAKTHLLYVEAARQAFDGQQKNQGPAA